MTQNENLRIILSNWTDSKEQRALEKTREGLISNTFETTGDGVENTEISAGIGAWKPSGDGRNPTLSHMR